ncbi:FAD-binding oxidoreductase [Georgenia sp. SUBG003]|uniref:FAD-binding oxidoreductase n=1 Tax=Georgenia sp. SUBG003 TaxID=1497974 RepID=UPI0004D7EB2F|nr:FAD-linked oxidase [Georgenia sp. SUBG003]
MNPSATTTTLAERLRPQLTGRVITPGDADYDPLRTTHYGAPDARPAVIVRAASTSDVVHAVTAARESGLELAVRSGGHSAAGHSTTQSGILLDLGDMKDLEIDAGNRTALAQPGLTAGEYNTAVAEHGLATGFGDTTSVGVAGITLGGGVGLLTRRYGLTIDSLLAVEIVTADGRVLEADAERHPDLFWAVRGGGGNFGVVTRLTFQLHPVDQVVGGLLVLPATAGVIEGFARLAAAAPDELTTIANLMPYPPMPFVPEEIHGRPVLMAQLVHTGTPAVAEQTLAPFRALAQPYADLVRPMRYTEIFQEEDMGAMPEVVVRGGLVRELDARGAATLADAVATPGSPRIAQLRVLGGAVARVGADATAYAHRDVPMMLMLVAFCEGPEDRARQEAWLEEASGLLDTATYVNFLGRAGADEVRAAYPGRTWDRLVEAKRRYDPENLFRLNHNVTPG